MGLDLFQDSSFVISICFGSWSANAFPVLPFGRDRRWRKSTKKSSTTTTCIRIEQSKHLPVAVAGIMMHLYGQERQLGGRCQLVANKFPLQGPSILPGRCAKIGTHMKMKESAAGRPVPRAARPIATTHRHSRSHRSAHGLHLWRRSLPSQGSDARQQGTGTEGGAAGRAARWRVAGRLTKESLGNPGAGRACLGSGLIYLPRWAGAFLRPRTAGAQADTRRRAALRLPPRARHIGNAERARVVDASGVPRFWSADLWHSGAFLAKVPQYCRPAGLQGLPPARRPLARGGSQSPEANTTTAGLWSPPS